MGQITGINGIDLKSGAIAPKGILFAPELAVSVPVIVANTGLVADSNGKKILKAGTPLYGDLQARGTAFVSATDVEATSNAVGIILHDTDVTAGNVNAQCLIFGFVDLTKVDTGVVSAAAQAALKGKISFIK